MDIQEIETNIQAAEEGVSFAFGEDCEVKIAQWHNKEHKKFLRKIYQKHGRKIENNAINDEQSDKIMAPQWTYIVKGWSGFTDDGKPFPFSEERLLAMAVDKKFAKFFERIANISKDETNFRAKNISDMGESSPTI